MSGSTNMHNPTVSILTPSYNHEKYVSCFINSLLSQTNPDWELIIVDDCSSDNTLKEIKKYNDSRIKIIEHKYNQGINAALNSAFRASKGQYIAFCASDDILEAGYVDDIIQTMQSKPQVGTIYYTLQCMDIEGNIIKGKILKSLQHDKYKALHHCFYLGNCFVSPGMCFRRELFEQVYPLHLSLSQYQDYKLHIELLLRSEIYLSDKILIKYRLPSVQSGISFLSTKTKKQMQLEENILMDSFLQIKDVSTLEKIFADDIQPYGDISTDFIPYILGDLALNSPCQYKQIWGYNQISRFLNTEDNYNQLNQKYGFCYKDFLNLSNRFLKNDKQEIFRIKYKKYQKLFNFMISFSLLCFILMIIAFFC